jgi:hypothetical protein
LFHESGSVSGWFDFGGLRVVDLFEMDVERASAGERLIRPDGVEELAVGLDVEAEEPDTNPASRFREAGH